VVFLVPTAQGHNALRTLIYKKEIPGMQDQTEVFRDPIGHPSPPVVALNAYLHFAVLYPFTGFLMLMQQGRKEILSAQSA